MNSHSLVGMYSGCLGRASMGELLPDTLDFCRSKLPWEIAKEDAIACLEAILQTPDKGLGFATVARAFSMLVYNKTRGSDALIDLIAEIDHKAGEILTEIKHAEPTEKLASDTEDA